MGKKKLTVMHRQQSCSENSSNWLYQQDTKDEEEKDLCPEL
jgi:hypothetical protein